MSGPAVGVTNQEVELPTTTARAEADSIVRAARERARIERDERWSSTGDAIARLLRTAGEEAVQIVRSAEALALELREQVRAEVEALRDDARRRAAADLEAHAERLAEARADLDSLQQRAAEVHAQLARTRNAITAVLDGAGDDAAIDDPAAFRPNAS